MNILRLQFLFLLLAVIPVSAQASIEYLDEYTIQGTSDYWRDVDAIVDQARIHVVVEIPAGSNEKWEVDTEDGLLKWEFKKGKPRIVKYLPYVVNYGMIPQTLFSTDMGGDGDPMDVLVLGPNISRGSIVKARVIGILKLLDDGESDHKVITVVESSPFYNVGSIAELEEKFSGVTDIIQAWFQNYKGAGRIKMLGVGEAHEAMHYIKEAHAHYKSIEAA